MAAVNELLHTFWSFFLNFHETRENYKIKAQIPKSPLFTVIQMSGKQLPAALVNRGKKIEENQNEINDSWLRK